MIKVAIGSLGTIGLKVAERLDQGIEGLTLSAVAASSIESAQQRVAQFSNKPEAVSLAALVDYADIVVECAPASVFREIAEPTIEAGKVFMPLSVGALLSHWDLVDQAKKTGAQILVPSGALLGLDAVRAASEEEIHLSLIHIPSPRDRTRSRMPSSA